jgi:hypothetical protein
MNENSMTKTGAKVTYNQGVMTGRSFEWREFIEIRDQQRKMAQINDPEERVEFHRIRYIRLCHKVLFRM